MFSEIGKKIKGLAQVVCWSGIIICVCIAFYMFYLGSESYYGGETYVVYGWAIMIIGGLASWVGSFFVYGFGELIDKVCDIERKISESGCNGTFLQNTDSERINKLEGLLAKGLITEEEYKQALMK